MRKLRPHIVQITAVSRILAPQFGQGFGGSLDAVIASFALAEHLRHRVSFGSNGLPHFPQRRCSRLSIRSSVGSVIDQ